MRKNVLFSLKNCKNCQTLGALSPCLRRLGESVPKPEMSMDRSRILTFFGRIGSEPDWALEPDRIRSEPDCNV